MPKPYPLSVNRRAPCRPAARRSRPSRASSASPSAIGRPWAACAASRSDSIVSCGNAAIASASSSARATCVPAGTTSLTSPMASASSPAPVSTITRAPSSAAKRSYASSSARAVSPSTALRRSGRSIVMTAAWPSRVYETMRGWCLRRRPGDALIMSGAIHGPETTQRPRAGSCRGRTDSILAGAPRDVKRRLPAAAQVGALAARLGRGQAAVLAPVQRGLDQREDEDQDREAGDEDEAGVGDHLVVGRPVDPLAAVVALRVRGQRDRRRQGEDEQREHGDPPHAPEDTLERPM